jgi:hypothetical protein
MRLPIRTVWRMASATLALLAMTLLLAACGGGSGDSGSGDSASEKAGLKYARCMREHGVDMPDPGPNGEVRLRARPGEESKIQAAQKACSKYLAGLARKASPAQQQAMQDAALRYARCMRQNGVDFPDPKFENGGIRFGGPGLNPNSPRFQQADKACRRFMPGGGKGGKGGATGFSTGGKP